MTKRTNHKENGANNSTNDDDDTTEDGRKQGKEYEREETNEWKCHTYNIDMIDYNEDKTDDEEKCSSTTNADRSEEDTDLKDGDNKDNMDDEEEI